MRPETSSASGIHLKPRASGGQGFFFIRPCSKFAARGGYLPHRTRTLHVSTMIAERPAISSILRIHPGSPGASLRLLVMVTFLVNWAANPRRNFSQKNGRSAIQLAPCPLVCVTATGRLAETVTKKAFPEHALIFLIVPVLGRRPVRLCGGKLLCTVA